MPDFNGLNVPLISNTNLPSVDPSLTENTYNSSVKPPAPFVPPTSNKESDLDIVSKASAESDWKDRSNVISGAELDANKRYKSYVPGTDMENEARWGQSGWERFKNATDNLVEKTLSYTVQTAGFLGGAAAALVGGAVNIADKELGGKGNVINDGHAFSLMTDNFMDQLADALKENVQERSLIYKSNTYSKGNIWAKLGTSDWWLDDAIDRVALTIATIAPGFLEAKGLGLFGAAIKGADLEATGLGSKLIQSIANSGNDYSKLGKILTEKVIDEGTVAAEMSSAGIKYVPGNLGTIADNFKSAVHMAQFAELTTINATAQNALNARESQVAIKKALLEQRTQGLNTLTDSEINDKSVEGGQIAFKLNAPLSLLTSLIEVPQIYASTKAINKALSKILTTDLGEKGIEKLASGAITSVEKSGHGFLYNTAKVLGTGFEHGHSESLQVAIGRMVEDAKSGKIVKDEYGNENVEYNDINGVNLWKEFIKNYSDPNGQNNLALGTIQGIITSMFGIGKSVILHQNAKQDNQNQSFLNDLNSSVANRKFYYTMSDMLQKDVVGKTVIVDGKAQFDQDKLSQLGTTVAGTLINHAKILDAYGTIHSSNDIDKISEAKKVIEDIKNDSFQNLAYTFFQDAQGKEVFKKLLKFESVNAKTDQNRENDVINNVIQTPDEILGKSLGMVDALSKVYNTIDQRYGTFLRLDNVDVNNKEEVKDYNQFKEDLKLQSYNDASKTLWAKIALENNQMEISSLGTDPASVERNTTLENENKSLQEDIEKSASAYLLHTNKEAVQTTWEARKKIIAENIKNTAIEKELIENPPKKEKLTVNTLTGTKDLEIGEQYYLGHIQHEDNSLGFPTLTILGKGDKEGTVKIKDANGTIRDVDETVLEKYRLGKVSDVDKSENSRFYFRNVVQHPNTIFYWNIGKKNNTDNFYPDNKIPGTIRYNYESDKLTFVYKNRKGEEVSKDTGLDQFKYDPSKFKEGVMSYDREQSKEDVDDIANRDKSGKTKIDQNSRRVNRLKILSDLYNEISSSQTEKNATIQSHKDTLNKIAETLASEKVTKQQLKALGVTTIKKLGILKDSIESEIKTLTNQSDTLGTELSYIQEMKDNIESYSEEGTEFLKDIENEIELTTELQTQIQKSIDELNGISKGIQSLVTKLVSVLQKTLPEDTLGYTDVIKSWFSEIANQDFTHFQDVKDFITDNTLLEGLEGKEEYTNISNADLADINERISKLQEWYDEESSHLTAQKKVLDRFKTLAEKYKQQKIQEKKIVDQTNKITKSHSDQQPPVHERPSYEAANKKSDFDVVNATKPNPDRLPHQVRTDNFGIKWNKLTPEERKQFKTIDVTQHTEEQLGLGGLMKHLLKEETKNYKWDLTVARVIVNDKGQLVDQEGKVITETPLDNALYQVMPQPDENGHLMAYYNGNPESMFRETNPSYDTKTYQIVKDNLEKQYIAQRNQLLASKTLQPMKDFYMSFGSPIYEYVMDENGEIKKDAKGKPIINYNARTSVEAANLITTEQLTSTNLVEVVTLSEDVVEGTVSMHVPKGFTLLRIPGIGIVKLFSRLLNNKESNTIFDVLVQLTKDLENNVSEHILNTKYNWLKSIVYWGIIKDDGGKQIVNSNNIYFKNITDINGVNTPTLFVGKTPYQFTSDGLTDNKTAIINSLGTIYHNIDAKLTNDSTRPTYNEIVKVDVDGKLTVRTWQNYQTYLLANTYKGTSRGDIPLTTPYKAIKDKGDINRKDFYISTSTDADDAIHSTVTPEELIEKKPLTALNNANKPISFAKKVPAETSSPVFKLDGSRETVSMLKYGDIDFSLDAKKFIATDGEEGFAIGLPKTTSQAIIDAAAVAGKTITEQDAKDVAEDYLINHKFAVQLAEMSNSKEPAIETPKEVPTEENRENSAAYNTPNKPPEDNPFREQLARSARRFSPENWVDFENFLKTNFPNLPTYRLKNIIQRTNGKQAWGMLQRGAMYIYENAGIGTGYHEVFEGVWKMFATPEEKVDILNEFRNSRPAYTDRFTGEQVDPKTTTDQQIKEEIAEEFVDFVLDGKVPERNTKRSVIGQLFQDLVNFIKTFFTGTEAKNNTQKLFDKIGNGYYKQFIPYETKLSYANVGIIDINRVDPYDDSDFRDSKEIPGNQMNDIIQHLNYMTITSLLRNGESIFNIDNISKSDLYDLLKNDLLERVQWMRHLHEVNRDEKKITKEEADRKINDAVDLFHNIQDQWKNIVQTHIEYLKEKNITFDDNEIAILNEDEDNVEKNNYLESNKIDSFRQMNSSVKLMLGTLPMINSEGTTVKSTVGGVICLPADQVDIQLKNELSGSITPDDMFMKLGEYGFKNINYKVLYNRIIGTPYQEGSIDYSNVDKSKLQIISEFWKSYNKQSPDAVTIFILPGGETIVSNSMFKGASETIGRDMINNIVDKIKKGIKYFNYNIKDGTYKASDTLKGVSLKSRGPEDYINFLKNIGIDFTPYESRLTGDLLNNFKLYVTGIRDSFKTVDGVKVLNAKTLGDMSGRLKQLADIQATFDHPELESTRYNLNNEKVQNYMNPNVFSRLYNVLSNIKNINELNNKTFKNFRYILTDSFTKGSEMVKRMFNEDTGKKNDGTENLMHPVIGDGISDRVLGKDTQVSRISLKQRLIQDLNLNKNGIYANLVPGDAALEAAMRMHTNTNPFITSDNINFGQQFDIFKGYFLSEVNISREDRVVAKGRDTNSLRFFKDILDEETYNKIMEDTHSPEEVYDDNVNAINSSIEKFFRQETEDMMTLLRQYGILNVDEKNNYSLESIAIKGNTIEDIETEMYRMALNFAVANIELHKLIYGDPYQYNMELKRTKLFGSPKQEMFYNSDRLNKIFDKVYNEGFAEGDIGWIDMDKEFFNTVTYDDILSQNDLPGYTSWKETDGATLISLKANKVFGIRTNNWTDDNERQYKHDIEYEKLVKDLIKGGKTVEEIKKATDEFEKSNPNIASIYTPRKPSVSGNKDSGRSYNSVVEDKTAQFVQSFRLLHQMNTSSNALALYNKLESENIDYAIFLTGRKEGAEVVHTLYDGETLNQTPYTNEIEILDPDRPQGIVKIPFSIFGVQTEVPSKENAHITEGSQMRAMVMMDLNEGGVPLDFIPTEGISKFSQWRDMSYDDKLKSSDLFKEMERNRKILKAKQEHGFQTLIKGLGIIKTDGEYIIDNIDKLVKTLKSEIFKYNINDNIIKSFKDFKNGTTLLEATPLYSQLRSIIYSIADKQVIRTKISGRMSVQTPSTLFESKRIKIKTIKGKDVYTSDVLDFYVNKDGKRVCQIAVSRWFDSDLSDEELLKYLNTTPEGKKILSGIAFRIPTQNKNSIDSFEIGFFLPKEMRDQVIVPSALVNKVGSDFDIDKLSIYLKNVFKDDNNEIKPVEYKGSEEATKQFYDDMFSKTIRTDIENVESKDDYRDNLLSILSQIDSHADISVISPKTYLSNEEYLFYSKHLELLYNIIDQADEQGITGSEYVQKQLDKAGDIKSKLFVKLFSEEIRTDYVENMYRKSLENEYIDSLQQLTSHSLNFDRMTSPNNADLLKGISEDIVTQTGQKKTDYSSLGNMLKRSFMANLRHAFVTGKQLIAIAAVNQKGHAQRQRVLTYIDPERTISDKDKKWIDDGQIRFKYYNKVEIDGKMKAVFSMLKDARGENYISDVNSQIIDGSVDVTADNWITGLGIRPNTLGTWLLLIDLGVPIKSISYFMNQPIIRDFLGGLDASGQKWLFNDLMYKAKQSIYQPSSTYKGVITEIPSDKELFDMLKYNQGKTKLSDVSDLQKAQQQFILKEFMKYAKMAEHSFYITQGSNYDTAAFNDPMLIDQKYWQLNRARNTIISSVDDLLKDSFSGDVATHLNEIRDAFAEVLTTDKINTRNTLYETLFPYFKLNAKDFLRISHKAVNDLIDWTMQNSTTENKIKLNSVIKPILVGVKNKQSEVADVLEYKDKVLKDPTHPLYKNTILNSLKLISGTRKGSADNLKIQGRDGKSYNQNLIIHGFEELKNELAEGTPQEQTLYRKLLYIAVAQSGLSVSVNSFTSLLPYEDFKTIYNEPISLLEEKDLQNFNSANIFQRTNFNNTKIVPSVPAITILVDDYQTGGKKILNINEQFLDKKLQVAVKKGILPKLIERDTQSQYGDSDIIMYSYQALDIPASVLAKMRKDGDYSYSHKVLMKRVYTKDEYNHPIPYIYTTEYKGKIYEKQMYKAINTLGDGIHANELYDKLIPEDEDSTIVRPSVLDNGIDKVQKIVNGEIVTAEVEDQVILDMINNIKTEKDLLSDQDIPINAPIRELLSFKKNAPEGLPPIDRTSKTC